MAAASRRQRLGEIVLMVGSLVFAVGLMEVGARAAAGVLGLTSYMQYDDLLGWAAKPDTIKRHQDGSAGFDVAYHINSRGLRGPLHETARTGDKRRVVLLGDSNGFGWGLGEPDHLSARLEATGEFEVINLSLSGYSTDQELLRLRRDGRPFNPDAVILQVTPNDFEDLLHGFANQKPKPHFTLNEDGTLTLRNVPPRASGARADDYYGQSLPVPFKEWLEWHSYSYSYLNGKYFAIRRRYFPSPARGGGSGRSAESVRLFNRLVAELAKDVAEMGAQGVVLHAAPELRHGVIDTTLPVVDASHALEASRAAGVEPWFRDGYHWNGVGHRLVAEQVAPVLRGLARRP